MSKRNLQWFHTKFVLKGYSFEFYFSCTSNVASLDKKGMISSFWIVQLCHRRFIRKRSSCRNNNSLENIEQQQKDEESDVQCTKEPFRKAGFALYEKKSFENILSFLGLPRKPFFVCIKNNHKPGQFWELETKRRFLVWRELAQLKIGSIGN